MLEGESKRVEACLSNRLPSPLEEMGVRHEIDKQSYEAFLWMANFQMNILITMTAAIIPPMSHQRNESIAKRQAITDLIEKEVATHPYGGILLSFPYFGPIAAATIIAIVSESTQI